MTRLSDQEFTARLQRVAHAVSEDLKAAAARGANGEVQDWVHTAFHGGHKRLVEALDPNMVEGG